MICQWCGCEWFPSQYYPGACNSCGRPRLAPLQRVHTETDFYKIPQFIESATGEHLGVAGQALTVGDCLYFGDDGKLYKADESQARSAMVEDAERFLRFYKGKVKE